MLKTLAAIVCVVLSGPALAADQAYTIFTYRGPLEASAQTVKASEIRATAEAIVFGFKERRVSRVQHVDVAMSMTAKERCYQLFMARAAMASIKAGKLDATEIAEDFLKDSMTALDEVNARTDVRCEMR